MLELSRVLAGPWAAQTLADLGASVIKVERPGSGDDTRAWGPPFVARAQGGEDAAYFLSTNRGKRSVAIDFTQPRGQDLVRALAARSDVLIENFKVGGLARYGLDVESLRAAHPALVYCSITGFGQTGPYRDRPGYDLLIQAIGGLMSLTGDPEGAPTKVGVALTDIFAGLYAVVAIQAALAERERSGEGRHIDISLFDVQAAVLANQSLNYLVSGQAPERLGNRHPNIVPYQTFEANDGHLVIAVGNDGQFQRFCEVLGAPELAQDARFHSNPLRVTHRDALVALLEPRLRERSRAQWLAALETAGVPSGPIQDLEELFRDPQLVARGLQIETRGEDILPGVASPIRFDADALASEREAPRLSQHTEEVLAEELGLPGEEIAQLREAGVIQGSRISPGSRPGGSR